MNRSDHEEAATAYHEAGHAVLTHYLGYKNHLVSIVPDAGGEYFGLAVGDNPLYNIGFDEDWGRDAEKLRAAAIILLAGGQSQDQFAPGSVEREQVEDDESLALECALRYATEIREDSQVAANELTTETRRLVVQLWPQIMLLAQGLLERKTIPGDEVRSLLSNG